MKKIFSALIGISGIVSWIYAIILWLSNQGVKITQDNFPFESTSQIIGLVFTGIVLLAVCIIVEEKQKKIVMTGIRWNK